VFDGLDEPGLFNDYDWFLPRSGIGDIIVTSRHETAQNLGESVSVGRMSLQEAVDLLLRISLDSNSQTNPLQRDQASELATYLGFLPLGLELAGTYIRHSLHGDLKRYLDWIESDTEHFYQNLAVDSLKQKFLSHYNYAIFVTWEKSLASLLRNARNFLHLCGFFDQSQLCTRLFKDATRSKFQWRSDGKLQELPPRSACVPEWLLEEFRLVPNGTNQDSTTCRGHLRSTHSCAVRLLKMKMAAGSSACTLLSRSSSRRIFRHS